MEHRRAARIDRVDEHLVDDVAPAELELVDQLLVEPSRAAAGDPSRPARVALSRQDPAGRVGRGRR